MPLRKDVSVTSAADGTVKGIRIPGYLKAGDSIVQLTPPTVRLVAVKNRGETFEPPRTHLGKQIMEPTPFGVAALAFAFLERVIEDASRLPP